MSCTCECVKEYRRSWYVCVDIVADKPGYMDKAYM